MAKKKRKPPAAVPEPVKVPEEPPKVRGSAFTPPKPKGKKVRYVRPPRTPAPVKKGSQPRRSTAAGRIMSSSVAKALPRPGNKPPPETPTGR